MVLDFFINSFKSRLGCSRKTPCSPNGAVHLTRQVGLTWQIFFNTCPLVRKVCHYYYHNKYGSWEWYILPAHGHNFYSYLHVSVSLKSACPSLTQNCCMSSPIGHTPCFSYIFMFACLLLQGWSIIPTFTNELQFINYCATFIYFL